MATAIHSSPRTTTHAVIKKTQDVCTSSSKRCQKHHFRGFLVVKSILPSPANYHVCKHLVECNTKVSNVSGRVAHRLASTRWSESSTKRLIVVLCCRKTITLIAAGSVVAAGAVVAINLTDVFEQEHSIRQSSPLTQL